MGPGLHQTGLCPRQISVPVSLISHSVSPAILIHPSHTSCLPACMPSYQVERVVCTPNPVAYHAACSIIASQAAAGHPRPAIFSMPLQVGSKAGTSKPFNRCVSINLTTMYFNQFLVSFNHCKFCLAAFLPAWPRSSQTWFLMPELIVI
jgi:hypothetical protein